MRQTGLPAKLRLYASIQVQCLLTVLYSELKNNETKLARTQSPKIFPITAQTDKHERKMDKLFSIILGTPKHGWLPVDFHYNDFHYNDFHLDFAASDVLNDPIEELYNVVTKLQNNEVKRITWWLEPGAYFFDFEKKGQVVTLTIIETDDLHSETAENKHLIAIAGDEKEIIEPFRIVLRQFSSQTYEENHWPYNLAKNKVKNL